MNHFTRHNTDLGITIILVTHEPDIAEYSDRKIIFRDGLIISDAPVAKKTRRITKRKGSGR
jgi:putative ABC transport system ATP-binding protein